MAQPSKLDEGPGPLQIESIYVFGNCAMYLGEQIEEEILSRNNQSIYNGDISVRVGGSMNIDIYPSSLSNLSKIAKAPVYNSDSD